MEIIFYFGFSSARAPKLGFWSRHADEKPKEKHMEKPKDKPKKKYILPRLPHEVVEMNLPKLPDEVVEMIISRIPFPFIFKARLLSRSWYFKFPLVPQFVYSLVPSTQHLVSSVSSKWATYCPVYVTDKNILGFDQASARWKTLMDVSRIKLRWLSVTSAGPLVGGLAEPGCYERGLTVSVTNSLTRSWRDIKFSVRGVNAAEVVALKIILQGSHAYKVLLVVRYKGSSMVTSKVYDSSCKSFIDNVSKEVSSFRIYPANAYLHGKLYCLFANPNTLAKVSLWIYDLEDNMWDTILDRRVDGIDTVADCGVVLCDDKVMVVICAMKDEEIDEEFGVDDSHEIDGFYTAENSIHILQLDLVTLKLKSVSSGPKEEIYGVGLQQGGANFASDSHHIYFGQTCAGTAVLRYDIQSGDWDCLPPACYKHRLTNSKFLSAAFQPGLSPFIVV